jgi:hypothetical protein
VVSAVPLPEFISWLHRRPEILVEGCLSSLMLGKKCRQANDLPGPPVKWKRRRKPRVTGNAAEETAAEESKATEGATDAAEMAAVLSNG